MLTGRAFQQWLVSILSLLPATGSGISFWPGGDFPLHSEVSECSRILPGKERAQGVWEQDLDERPVEANSIDGSPLRRMEFPAELKNRMELELETARKRCEFAPDDPDNLIWVGRRLAYLSRFRESIDVFTDGIERFPDDARFLRHRGHRWITVREFARAVEDLEKASQLIEGQPDQVEPDGKPNAAGIPTSTLHTNIWYHLGLAKFLLGDFSGAEAAYRKCLAAADNNDMRVATLDWLYMTLCRLDRKPEADELVQHVTAGMEILENEAYLRRILLYRGLIEPHELIDQSGDGSSGSVDRNVTLATNGFGVAHWHLVQGRTDAAKKLFRQVTAGKNWGAFGFIAAEVELQRIPLADQKPGL